MLNRRLRRENRGSNNKSNAGRITPNIVIRGRGVCGEFGILYAAFGTTAGVVFSEKLALTTGWHFQPPGLLHRGPQQIASDRVREEGICQSLGSDALLRTSAGVDL